ncbi:MAG: hypothetical protein K6L74_06725 [Neptuniibacter sp.]
MNKHHCLSPLRRKILLGWASGAVLAATGGLSLVLYKDQSWVNSPHYSTNETKKSKTLVVVYSRSGNTLIAAKEAAGVFQADLLNIVTDDYPLNIMGQLRAMRDALNLSSISNIQYSQFNTGEYDKFILCSPVWMFRPAIPIWAFVKASDFSQKSVYLLMTGNSKYEEKNITLFSEQIKHSNGFFSGYDFIERGRALWQLSSEELQLKVNEVIKDRFF